MTKETAKDYLPLVQALAEGKTIQSNIHGTWVNVDDPNFRQPPELYRIKPEARRGWISAGWLESTKSHDWIEVVEVIK